MNQQQIDTFIIANNNYFRHYQIPMIRGLLMNADDTKWISLQTLRFKDPVIALVISLLLGYLGIDRFFIGDIGLGILKLITCGGFGIWTVIDWFLIMGSTRDKNFRKLNSIL